MIILFAAMVFIAPFSLANSNTHQMGVTTATFDKCYSQFKGWNRRADDFLLARNIVLRKIKSLPSREYIEAMSVGEQWSNVLDAQLRDKDKAAEFCNSQYDYYGLHGF